MEMLKKYTQYFFGYYSLCKCATQAMLDTYYIECTNVIKSLPAVKKLLNEIRCIKKLYD